MVLQTLDAMGPLHGYGIARRIEQISEDVLQLNQGTIYASLLRLQQRRWISASWGTSDNNRKAKFYAITKTGRKQLATQAQNWERISARHDAAAPPRANADVMQSGSPSSPSRAARSALRPPRRTRSSSSKWRRTSTCSTEEHIRRGMAPDEARRQAMLRFGGSVQTENSTTTVAACRSSRRRCRTSVTRCRTLRRQPGFTHGRGRSRWRSGSVPSPSMFSGRPRRAAAAAAVCRARPADAKSPRRIPSRGGRTRSPRRRIWRTGARATASSPRSRPTPASTTAGPASTSASLTVNGEPAPVKGIATTRQSVRRARSPAAARTHVHVGRDVRRQGSGDRPLPTAAGRICSAPIPRIIGRDVLLSGRAR